MKLYVCWGTWSGGGNHSCGKAYDALKEAGYDPEVEKVHGWGALPDFMNGGRKDVMELTGEKWVPVLVTDDGQTLKPSDAIAEWAKTHPAP